MESTHLDAKMESFLAKEATPCVSRYINNHEVIFVETPLVNRDYDAFECYVRAKLTLHTLITSLISTIHERTRLKRSRSLALLR